MQSLTQVLKTPLIVSSLILCCPAWADTAPTDSIDISGNYICSGKDISDNSQFTEELTVKKTGDVYVFTSQEKGINNQTQKYLGTGLFAKNSNSTFAATFWQENDPNKSGIMIGQIQPDGGWESVWTWRDSTRMNSEVCKKKNEQVKS